jgi:outer membrane protein assembly factor BamB
VESGGREVWRHKHGCGLTAPVVTNEQLMFGSSSGMYLKSLDPQSGKLLWRVYTGGEMTENVPAIYGDMLFAVSKNGWLNAVK